MSKGLRAWRLFRVFVFGLCAVVLSARALAAIAIVQDNSSCPAQAVRTLAVPFVRAQVVGHLNYVAIGWVGLPRTILSVTDSKGNAYVPATGVKSGPNGYAQVIFYAKNIVAAAAGTNSVLVAFDAPVSGLDVRIAEYSGLSTTNVLDGAASGSGTGTSTVSGAAVTKNANDLLIATNRVENTTTAPGAGFTRQLTTVVGSLLEYRVVSAAASYSAGATQSPSGAWVMQMVAFRAAGSTVGGDTQAPSAPASLSATVAVGTPVKLSWSASTDNVRVTAYVVERCKGAGCSGFAQIAIPSGTTYADAGLAASSNYTYRVRAIDGAGNLSAASTVAVTTPASSQTLEAPTGLQVAALSSSEVDLEWAASGAGSAVSAYLLERCEGASCTNFSQIATPASPRYGDVGRTSSTRYSYRVRARDAANTLSGYSNIVTTMTPAASPDCD